MMVGPTMNIKFVNLSVIRKIYQKHEAILNLGYGTVERAQNSEGKQKYESGERERERERERFEKV